MKSYRITLEEDGQGNLIIPLPEELLEHLEVSEGDILNVEKKEGMLYITKKN